MARTIMDAVQENVNPVSVSNTLYEIMLDWRTCVMLIDNKMYGSGEGKQSKSKLRYKKALIERYLAWFMGTDGKEIRTLLHRHFGIEEGKR